MYVHLNETQAALREVARACACANLRKAARVVTQLFDEVLAPSGLKARRRAPNPKTVPEIRAASTLNVPDLIRARGV
jgi:hypothetical protein